MGSCPILNGIIEEAHAVKQETFVGRHASVEIRRVKRQEDCSALWLPISGFIVLELSVWVASDQSFCGQSLPGGQSFLVAHVLLSPKMDAREKDSGRWYRHVASFDLSQNSSSWRWLVSSMFI